MVDFNNESTVSTPPGEVVKIIVLERREQVIEALESYYRSLAADLDTSVKIDVLYARLMAFWFQIEAMARRRLKDARGGEDDLTFEQVRKAVINSKNKFDAMIEAFEWMNQFVDKMGLTVIDGRAQYDRRNIEDANLKKGL